MRTSIAAIAALALCPSYVTAQARPAQLNVLQRVEHVEAPTREPMVAEHPGGALFVAGYGGTRPTLWKSVNGGAAWTRVDVGTEEQGAIGNSDADLAVAADGTLYFLSMLYDRTAAEGRQIAIGVSRDAGETWSWKTLSKVRFDDRPWIDLAPDGTAHIIWNDGSGVSHVASRDRGATWSPAKRVHDKGGSSHLAVGPNGEVAVMITPASASGRQFDAGVELIAVSVDQGRTWQKSPAPGQREWAPLGTPGAVPRWVEPIAWDSAGHLYSLWTDTAGVFVARSTDRAKSWSTWQVVRMPATFFPYLIARGRGQLAASWFSMSTPTGGDLRWHAALIDVGVGSAAPRVIQSAPTALDAWRRVPGGDALAPDAGGEYLGMIFLRDGGIGLATPIQNPATQRFGFTWWRLGTR